MCDPEVVRRGLRPIVIQEVEKMLACGTKYAKLRAASITKHILSVRHRHIVFTIDERLRDFFLKVRNLLNLLFKAAKETLFYTFNKMNGKHHTFTPGFILTLHTFGRALNFNPHIHCLITEGGMNEDNQYKSINYITFEALRKSFMKQLLDNMKLYYVDNLNYSIKIKELINQIYKDKKKGFYVNAPKMKAKNGKDAVVSYIIRYIGRPVMASSRIVSYDKEKQKIHYYYEDHKTEERVDVEEDVFTFIKKLIIHIPEAQFKMIRYYGIYATCHHRHKTEVKKKLFSNYSTCIKKPSYR